MFIFYQKKQAEVQDYYLGILKSSEWAQSSEKGSSQHHLLYYSIPFIDSTKAI